MAESIPKEEWRATHNIEPNLFTSDVYHLLTYFMSSKSFASLESADKPKSLSNLARYWEGTEIPRMLIAIAATIRAKSDDGSWGYYEDIQTGQLTEDLKCPDNVTPLTLREACNKIIHADKVHFDTDQDKNTSVEYLNPIIYLYGKRGNQEWKVVLSILEFGRAANSIIF